MIEIFDAQSIFIESGARVRVSVHPQSHHKAGGSAPVISLSSM